MPLQVPTGVHANAISRHPTLPLDPACSFDNALPEVPCDPKLLVHQFDKAAFVRYQYDSNLEMTHKYELLAEPDLGISIDLVDPAVRCSLIGPSAHARTLHAHMHTLTTQHATCGGRLTTRVPTRKSHQRTWSCCSSPLSASACPRHAPRAASSCARRRLLPPPPHLPPPPPSHGANCPVSSRGARVTRDPVDAPLYALIRASRAR